MKIRVTVWILLVVNILCGSVLLSRAFGSGDLTVTPTHDFSNGEGYTAELEIEQHLRGHWYATPTAFVARLNGYRDAYGKLNFEYEWTDGLRTGVGYGFDSYRHYGEDLNESHDVHGYVKLKLWK